MEDGYELLDAGDGRRLERFADVVVDRPAPGARDPRRLPDAEWDAADGRFDRLGSWTWRAGPPGPWTIELAGLRFRLRAAVGGQVGLFPEHGRHWPWLAERPPGQALNLFGYTGAGTLALARAGHGVTHVDAARTAVNWARENAALNSLAEAPIRWIVDDAAEFVRRESRRGRRYRGAIVDPPSYGHGSGARVWRIERDLPDLLEALDRVLEPDAWLLVTSHTTGFRLDEAVRGLPARALELEAASGARLAAGDYVRWPPT